jgi:uncharacterized protein YjbJ (UPF0337 family)
LQPAPAASDIGHSPCYQKLRGEGLIDQAKGKTQAGYGDAKEKLKGAIDRS